eukprot:8480415-Alexandrium_andersonii.AAC.1
MSPARVCDAVQDMRPLGAQTLPRPNGAMLVEEATVILGANIATISSSARARATEGELAHEARGACPYTAGDSQERLTWLSR